MIQLDEKKLAKLKTTNQLLDEKYGKHGTASRESFNERTMAWYYGDILRERRKELKLTQNSWRRKSAKNRAILPALKKEKLIYNCQASFVLLVLWVLSLLQHSFYRIIIEIFEKARELESKIKQPEPLKLSNPGCA